LSRRIKRIMFIVPPVTRPADFSAEVVRISVFFPLGIAYLAATLEKTGDYEIRILDALLEGDIREGVKLEDGFIRYGLTDEKIAEAVTEFSPDFVGVSCLFAAMQQDAAKMCSLVKSLDKSIHTALGGPHAGANGDWLLANCPSLDFVITGEGEESLPSLLNALNSSGELSKVDGLAYRTPDGKISINEKRTYIEDLDTLAFPARHLFDMGKYLTSSSAHSVYRKSPYTQMITSRGCPCKCTFCALGNHWGANQRMRSAENVLQEIDLLVKDYGIKEIHFEDDNLTADKERAIKIFNGLIERNYDLSWNVPSGMAAYTLDDEILEKMAASGCYSVSLAIESGNQDVIKKLMNKPVNLKKIPGLVKKIREQGMDARGFFILGYPDETRENIRETVDFARSVELDWAYFFIASPLPHTKMWQTCIDKKYITAEDFDPVRSFHKSIIRTPEFDPEYLAEIREEAIVDVNFRNNPNLRKYNIDKAIENFKDVVMKYPHFDFANFYLGEAYLKKGDTKMALESYQNTLKANPEHSEAKKRIHEMSGKNTKTSLID